MVQDRTIHRWILPPGVSTGERVRLRFHLDAAGSASKVSLVETSDNALGASAVDALRAAAPFPSMPENVRCLSQIPIVGTFTNPVGWSFFGRISDPFKRIFAPPAEILKITQSRTVCPTETLDSSMSG